LNGVEGKQLHSRPQANKPIHAPTLIRATRSYNAQFLLIQMPVVRLIAAELSPLSER